MTRLIHSRPGERSEVALFERFRPIADADKWETYAEVTLTLPNGGQRVVDLIGLRDGEWHAWCGKKTLSPCVIDQATAIAGIFDFVSVVCWTPRRLTDAMRVRRAELLEYGVGLVYVHPDSREAAVQFDAHRSPQTNHTLILASIHEDQRDGPKAGVAAARRVTPDRWDAIRSHLAAEGPAPIRALRAELKQYGRSEWSRFSTLVKRGEVRGITVDDAGGVPVYAVSETSTE